LVGSYLDTGKSSLLARLTRAAPTGLPLLGTRFEGWSILRSWVRPSLLAGPSGRGYFFGSYTRS